MSLNPHKCFQILALVFLVAPLSVAQVAAQSDSSDSAQDAQQESSQSQDEARQQGRGDQPEDEQGDRERGEDAERSQPEAQQRQRAQPEAQQQQDRTERQDSRSGLLERLRSRRESRREQLYEGREDSRDRAERRYRPRRDEQAAERDPRQDRARDQTPRRDGPAQRYRVTPEGWVRIGADYDDDGIYESVETVYILDLDRATRRSHERRQQMREQRRGEQQTRQGERRESYRPAESRMRRGRPLDSTARSDDRRSRRLQPRTVEGTIAGLQPLRLAGMKSPHLLAKMDTQRYGRIPVCLGPREELSQLNLTTGDHVRIQGIKANINDRPVVFARRVSTGDQTVSVEMPQRRGHRRVEAEIRSTRTANFRRFDRPFLVGEVETRGGRTAVVNFGPESEVGKLDLQQGDRVRLLVRPGRVNGRFALIAEEIHTGDQRVRVPRPRERERFRGEDRSRQDDREERSSRADRNERPERSELGERPERSDRDERSRQGDRGDRAERDRAEREREDRAERDRGDRAERDRGDSAERERGENRSPRNI